MKIIFKLIELHNFMSWADAEVKLNDRNYVLVSGSNLNPKDSAKSNGSGKSAIFDAIVWALTGDTIRGAKDIKRIGNDDGTYVRMLFSVDNDEYELIRSKDHTTYKTNLYIIMNGENKSGKGIRDSEKLLAEYLPDLTSDLLGSVIVLGQGLPQRFTNNTPAGRKEVLEKLSKSDFMIEDLKNRISARKTSLESDYKSHSDSMISAQGQIEIFNRTIQDCDKELSNISDREILEAELVMHTEAKDELEKELTSLLSNLAENENNYTVLNNKLTDIMSDYAALCSNLAQKRNALIESIKVDEHEAELAASIQSMNGELKAKQIELNNLKKVKDICPTCGQKLIGVTKPDTTQLEGEIANLQIDIQNTSHEYQIIQNKISNALTEFDASCEDSQHEHNNDVLNYKNKLGVLQTHKQALTNKIESIRTNIQHKDQEISTIQRSLANLESRIEYLTASRTTAEHEIEKLQTQIEELVTRCTDIHKHIDIISKFNTAVTRDFRGYLLTSVIDYINSTAKQYSELVFGNNDIEFMLSGNNISISIQGKEYEMLSGGEKQKVDLIIQFALRSMLCNYLNFSSNIIILDEIMDFLDSDGCDSIINLIQNVLNDISSVFIVTHHSDLNLPCDEVMNVVKTSEGISILQ